MRKGRNAKKYGGKRARKREERMGKRNERKREELSRITKEIQKLKVINRGNIYGN